MEAAPQICTVLLLAAPPSLIGLRTGCFVELAAPLVSRVLRLPSSILSVDLPLLKLLRLPYSVRICLLDVLRRYIVSGHDRVLLSALEVSCRIDTQATSYRNSSDHAPG